MGFGFTPLTIGFASMSGVGFGVAAAVAVFVRGIFDINAAMLKFRKEMISSAEAAKGVSREYRNQRSEMDALDPKYYMGIAPAKPNPSLNELRTQVRVLENEYRFHEEKINKINRVHGVCSECLQEVDSKVQDTMSTKEIGLRDTAKLAMADLWSKIPKAEKIEAEIKKYAQERIKFERLSQLINASIGRIALVATEEKEKLNELQLKIKKLENVAKSTEKKNLDISAHNSKVDVVKQQLDNFKKDLHEKNIDLMEKENLGTILELLKKTFGTNGLVSYKIESSVKELERKINEYLSELTYFQLYFKLSGERLNIEILDEFGNVMSMSNLSSGEKARTNIATILAIRAILSSLTNTKINLLFLDEITGSLDAEGKEKLSEILLQENLNTFFISHEWTHPLVPQINIIKEHHISRIEND